MKASRSTNHEDLTVKYLLLFFETQLEKREFVTLKQAKDYVRYNLAKGQWYMLSRIMADGLAE